MYRDLERTGNSRTGGGLSPKSVHNVQICLHAALEEAVRNRLIANNPADAAHRKPRTRPEMKTWQVKELRLFLDGTADRGDFAL